MKTVRTYRLSDECLAVIDRVAEDNNIGKTEALETIILRYEHTETDILREEKWIEALSEVLLEKFDQKYRNLHTRLRMGVGSAEFNSEVILDAVNMMLFHFGIKEDRLNSQIKMPVIENSQNHIRERLASFKQRKDEKRVTGHE